MVGPICSIDVSPGGRLVDIEPKPESRSSSVGCTKTRRICEFFLICVLMCTVSSSHLSKLPGNKKLNFFGEPFYVLPQS